MLHFFLFVNYLPSKRHGASVFRDYKLPTHGDSYYLAAFSTCKFYFQSNFDNHHRHKLKSDNTCMKCMFPSTICKILMLIFISIYHQTLSVRVLFFPTISQHLHCFYSVLRVLLNFGCNSFFNFFFMLVIKQSLFSKLYFYLSRFKVSKDFMGTISCSTKLHFHQVLSLYSQNKKYVV